MVMDLSKLFLVSINNLYGQPHFHQIQCTCHSITLSMTYYLMRPRVYYVTSSPCEVNMECIRRNTRMCILAYLMRRKIYGRDVHQEPLLVETTASSLKSRLHKLVSKLDTR
ncbi:unnamed protein product [Albugo candida]|uniref:Uncharacterized protein n=1 Tax=Albugo candida TaxID=65357 RepID=A0A024GM32_9STRA|nr:unnamed protein product [Albugo candida]|eukprot:CCI47591.1 unnamed protein product [Albugo candida]